jgi:hypothetical protein
MPIELERNRQGTAREIFEKSQESYAKPLIGQIIKTFLGGSYYLVIGVNDTGPNVDRGLKACQIEMDTQGAPEEIVVPWSTRVTEVDESETHALISRMGNRINRLKEKYLKPDIKREG